MNADGKSVPQDFVCELRIIVLFREDMQKFGHRFREMFKIRKILND